MNSPMFVGHNSDDKTKVLIDRDDLSTHSVILGRTGSGKTSLTHVLIEEAVMAGASVVVCDLKGDLTNLLLSFPGLTPQEFAPWVPAGKSAVDEAKRWSNLIKDSGQELNRVSEWHNAATFRVFTPGYAKSGQAINLLPSFDPPIPMDATSREKASHVVMTILDALGIDADPLSDPRSVYCTELLMWVWSLNRSLPLDHWPALIVDIPSELKSFDGMATNSMFPKKDRIKLASAIIGFRRQAARWLEGPTLNPDNFLMPGPDGRPQVTIFTLRHLGADDRQLFVSMFLSGLVDWMYKAPASGRLRALCVLDEAAGYLPPAPANPPTKRPICTLLAQGRSQGLGIILGTQNPNDLDYKALSNVGTWFLGGLRDRDVKRDLDAELKDRDVDITKLLRLPERTFMALTKDGKSHSLRVRCPLSYMRGPIDVTEINRLTVPISDLVRESPPSTLMKQADPSNTPKVIYGDVDITFNLSDPYSRKFDVEVTYSLNGGTDYHRMTPAENSISIKALQATPEIIVHHFLWDSVADLGYSFHPKVIICIKADGASGIMLPPTDVINNTLSQKDAWGSSEDSFESSGDND